jgi:cephalosporin-C deacetylase-like acetyl esterase
MIDNKYTDILITNQAEEVEKIEEDCKIHDFNDFEDKDDKKIENKNEIYEIKCNSSILSKIPYFKKILSSGMEEEIKGIIRFPELSEKSIREILKYIYIDEINVTHENCFFFFIFFLNF